MKLEKQRIRNRNIDTRKQEYIAMEIEYRIGNRDKGNNVENRKQEYREMGKLEYSE